MTVWNTVKAIAAAPVLAARTLLSRRARVKPHGGSADAFSGLDHKPIEKFFNRPREIKAFRKTLIDNPHAAINVVIGPPSSGKTNALLMALKGHPTMYLNLRKASLTHTDEFYDLLEQHFRSFFANFSDFVETFVPKLSLGGFEWQFNANNRDFPKLYSSMGTLVDKASKDWKKSWGGRPVIFVDEANRLQDLDRAHGDGHKRLRDFLSWLTAISKESNQIQVLLATSTPFFLDWITRFVHPSNIQLACIGHLDEQEAKKFIEEQCKIKDPQLIDRLYEIYGGKMRDLLDVTFQVLNFPDFKVDDNDTITAYRSDLLTAIRTPELYKFTGAEMDFGPARWKGSDLLRVMEELDRHKGFVDRHRVSSMIGDDALGSLLQYQVLVYRGNSNFVFDIPRTDVVSAFSPVQQFAMRQVLDMVQRDATCIDSPSNHLSIAINIGPVAAPCVLSQFEAAPGLFNLSTLSVPGNSTGDPSVQAEPSTATQDEASMKSTAPDHSLRDVSHSHTKPATSDNISKASASGADSSNLSTPPKRHRTSPPARPRSKPQGKAKSHGLTDQG